MFILNYIALALWLPCILVLFHLTRPRTAAAVAFVFGFLFLPMASIALPGALPSMNKITVTSVGVMTGMILFCPQRLFSFRPGWLDLPMIMWVLSPTISSLSNKLGLYDALSELMNSTLFWGIPYISGRVLFSDRQGLRTLVFWIFVGGLLYIPLCLFEVRMSPQLHRIVYGFRVHTFSQTKRWGGWRPQVFLTHGLMLALWMGVATTAGYCLWRSRIVRRVWTVPTHLLLGAIAVTTVACKSMGALVLTVAGIFALHVSKRTAWVYLLFVLGMPAILISRAGYDYQFAGVVEFIRERISEERAGSLQFRIDNETLLIEKALQQRWFGWGGWGRNRVYDDEGRDLTTVDSLWIIALGQRGVVGLVAFVAAWVLPAFLLVRRAKKKLLHPRYAPAAAAATIGLLFMYDCLSNAMPIPLYATVAAGVTGALREMKRSSSRAPSEPRAESRARVERSRPQRTAKPPPRNPGRAAPKRPVRERERLRPSF